MSELVTPPLPSPAGWDPAPAPASAGPARPERRRGLLGSLLAVLAGGAAILATAAAGPGGGR